LEVARDLPGTGNTIPPVTGRTEPSVGLMYSLPPPLVCICICCCPGMVAGSCTSVLVEDCDSVVEVARWREVVNSFQEETM